MLKVAILLALTAALPHPTNPPNPYTANGAPHYAVPGGPARGLLTADPFGDGSRVTMLGWYDAQGVVRFYEAENPQLYNAPQHRPQYALGVTMDPDGALNSGLAIGGLKPTMGESMSGNNDVAGDVFREATKDEMDRRKCNPDEPCGPDDDEPSDGTIKLTADQVALCVFVVPAFLLVFGLILRRR
ncbi:MAG: hypothetical protein P4L84_16020 [Isosphaeraceae bacterium]|nr:hypothetical protein [Isosphaeraceae bacterium]